MVTKSARETQKFGEKWARKLKRGDAVCLYGDLGAGKTTLVQGIARGLGVKGRVISPTFVLVRRHKLPRAKSPEFSKGYLYHIDLYRLDNIREAQAIGIEEIADDKDSIVVIEWAEKIKEILPKRRWEVRLAVVSRGKRKIDTRLVELS